MVLVTSTLVPLVPRTTVQCAGPHMYLALLVVRRALPALLVTLEEVLSAGRYFLRGYSLRGPPPKVPSFLTQELLNQQRACITLQVVIAFQCGVPLLLFFVLVFVLRLLIFSFVLKCLSILLLVLDAFSCL